MVEDAISAASDCTLKLWDTASGRELQTFKGHEDSVWNVRLTSHGRHAVSTSFDRTSRLWDVQTGNCLTVLPLDGSPTCFALSSSGPDVILGDGTGDVYYVRLWTQ